MAIRLVAVDLDGTLLNAKKEYPPDFPAWVIHHPEIQTVIASGRQVFTLEEQFAGIADHLIFSAENGALVKQRGKVLYQNTMDREAVRTVLRLAKSLPGVYKGAIVCGAQSAYMPPDPTEDAWENAAQYYAHLAFLPDLEDALEKDAVVKVALYLENAGAEALFPHFQQLPDHLRAVLSGDSWIDIANDSVSKGASLRAIQKSLGISREESMAFGDYLNDVTLLEACGESYAMKNAHPALKKIAKYITPRTNEEQGVMDILNTL